MKKICVVDRIEDGVIVLVPDDGSENIELSAESFPALRVNDAAVYEDGEIRPATADEHQNRMDENRERLRRLFGE